MTAAGTIPLQSALRAHKKGQLEPAEALYRSVLESDPDNHEAIHLLGVVLLQTGNQENALPLLEDACCRQPDNADYQNRYGIALAALGRTDDAIAAYRKAIACKPNLPEAHNNLAIALAAQGDQQAAIIAYRRALTAHPAFAEAHNGLGVALTRIGERDEAEHHYRRALQIQPEYFEARANLGDLLMRSNRLDDAVEELQAVLRQQPEYFEAHLSLADAFGRAGDIDKAKEIATKVLGAHSESARAHNCYGMVFRLAGESETAMFHLDRAIELDPLLADARANRAIARLSLGHVDAAERDADQAVALSADAPLHRMNRGMIRLLRGEFRRGFEDYRARFGSGAPWMGYRRFPYAEWNGEPIAGKRILAWGEQGVGEEIMFASLLARLETLASACTVECDPRLVPLFARSFPSLDFVGRADPVAPALLRQGIDCAIAFGDIPAALGLEVSDFAEPEAYLSADAQKVGSLEMLGSSTAGELKVGIAWRSRGANALFSLEKSTDLSDWSEILCTPGISIVSLQHGDVAAEISEAEARLGASIETHIGVDQATDLDGFAALITTLNLVITTSNTTAHLAGALGKDVWIIVPHTPDWRWQLDRSDTLWYPGARLFRQSQDGDWRGVLAAVSVALRERVPS